MRTFAQNPRIMNTNVTVYAVFLYLASLLIVSCHDDSDALHTTFSKIEKCIDAYPDSALNLLKAIPHPENLSGKSQADYALLMTQAMDKNYMKFSSDSLIAVALNYYTMDQRNPLLRAKTQFYYGRVMLELDDHEAALKSFLAAKSFYDTTKEYKMMALIAEEIGMINMIQDLHIDALKSFQISLTLHQQIKDSLSVVRASQNMARAYLFQNKWDSCFLYFNQALDISKQKGYKSETSILHELGVLYRQKEDLSTSESYFLEFLKKETNEDKLNLGYLSLGYLYLQMGDLDTARIYLEKSTLCSMLETQKDAYDCLYWLEKEQKRYRDALTYCEKADSIKAVLEKQNSQIKILDLQKKYENEKLQNENLQMKIEHANIIWIGAVVLLTVVFFMCYYYYKNKVNKKRIIEIEWQINDNEEEIKRYQQEVFEIQETKAQVIEKNRVLEKSRNTKVGELNGKIMLLNMQNRNLEKQLKDLGGEFEVGVVAERYMPAFRLLLAMKEGNLRGKLSYEDWEKLFDLSNLLYMNYISRLREQCGAMTKHDFEICCLLKFGLTHEELSRIFITTSDSLTKAKGRLKGRLGISSHDDLEFFLKNY